jgi:hypothetical protein
MRTYLDLFGENYDMYEEHENKHKFFTIANADYDEKLKWLQEDIKTKFNAASSRIEMYRKYEALFKGIHYKSMDYRRNENDDSYSGTKQPRMAVNFVQEMLETKVSQRAKNKPGYAVIPNNDEIDDINNAKTVKMLLDNRNQELDIDRKFSDGDRMNFMRGESFTFVTWDENSGAVHPEYKKAQANGIKIPRLDKNGQPIEGQFIDSAVTIGDVNVRVLGPERCFPEQNCNSFDECDDITEMDWMHLDNLKATYPEHADKITINDDYFFYDSADYAIKKRKNHAAVFTYWHRKTKFLPEGRKIVYVIGCILEDGPLPYSHGKLPCVFDTDIDVPDELHGRPFLVNIAQLQNLHNMCMASIARNIAVSSMPKWVMPKGTVHRDKLNNEYGIIEYSGPIAPQMVTYSAINKDLYEMPDKFEKYIQNMSMVDTMARGEPPPGIKAAVALQFLDEQDQQRQSTGIAKRLKRIKDTYKMMISVMGDYYKAEDGRMVRILGADNSYLINSFEQADFNCAYDIRILNTSSLPDSKAGRISAILDINTATQADPMFGKEEISQMLDLANDERFKDKASVAVRAAETVIGKILKRDPSLGEPQEWDDFIVMYPMLLKTLQERTYKDNEQDILQALKQYIMVMEGLMYNKAIKSPVFAVQLQRFYMFPVLFSVPAVPTNPAPAPVNTTPINTGAIAQNMVRQNQ